MPRVKKRGKCYQIDFYDEYGKRIRKTFKQKSTAEAVLAKALRKKDRVKAGLEIQITDFESKLTIKEFYQQISHHIKTYKTRRSYETYKTHFDNFFKYILDFKPEINLIAEIDTQVIQDYIFERLQRKISSNTVNHELDTLRMGWNIALRSNMGIKGNPFLTIIERPPRIKRPPYYYSKKDIQKIFEFLPLRFQPFFITLLHTGVRLGELLLFEWADFDSKNRMVYVRTKESRTERKMRTRSIPMSDKVRWAIDERRKLAEHEKYVFTTAYGETFRRRGKRLTEIWKEAMMKAGVRQGNVHTLRHTFASWLAQSGKVDLYQIKEWLGHKSITQTEIYAHLIPVSKSKLIDETFKF